MKQRERKEGREESERQEKTLLEILNRWDPFPGPDDEYQRIADLILSALRRGVSGAEIEALIMSNVERRFGTAVPEVEVRKVRQEIMAWWRKTSSSPNWGYPAAGADNRLWTRVKLAFCSGLLLVNDWRKFGRYAESKPYHGTKVFGLRH